MADQEVINILIRMQADVDAAMNKVKTSLGGLNDKSSKATQNLTKGFRDMISPLNMAIRTITRVGFIWGATFGAMVKSVLDVGKNIEQLDLLAVKFGTTAADLSKKIYGFNMATDSARRGVGLFKGIIEGIAYTFNFYKTKIAEAAGELRAFDRVHTIYASLMMAERKRLGREPNQDESRNLFTQAGRMARIQMDTEDKIRVTKNFDAQKLEAELSDKIKQLTMSTYEFKQEILRQEVEAYRLKGVSETKIEEYYAKQSQENMMSRFGFQKWADFVDNQFKTTIGSMKSTLAGFFNDAFTGELKKGKEYFADFAKSVLNMFSQMIAEMIARWMMFSMFTGGKSKVRGWLGILGSLSGLAGLGGAPAATAGIGASSGTIGNVPVSGTLGGGIRYHNGGIVRAHSGLAIDEIPIIAQRGERVLSREQNKRYEQAGSSQPVVVVIQAWDTSDLMRNERQIIGLFRKAMRFRSPLVEDIKRYA